MANPATFGTTPTVPITINYPVNQLPQPTATAPQQTVASQPQQQTQTDTTTAKQPSSPQPKLPATRYYVFPWSHSK